MPHSALLQRIPGRIPHRAAPLCGRDHEVFTVPGLNGSGPAHWQSAWERRDPRVRRVEQTDWAQPQLDAWARRVVEALVLARHPAIVVAHSFGCLATLRATAFQSGLIAGALLVAPARPERFEATAQLPCGPLEFPVTLVASDDDPWMPLEQARAWASRWQAELRVLPGAGHINTASGHTQWPDGLRLLEALSERVETTSSRRP